MLIDTHLHLIDRARLSYPWLEAVPALNCDWSYDGYVTSAARLGITGTLHMEVDVAEADIDRETTLIAGLMRDPDSLILGAISAARPESPAFRPWLEATDRSVVRGLRRVLHVVPDAVSQTAVFRENIRALGPAGLPFDICVLARQLPLAIDLADAAPDTTFVLDHCGVPDIAADGFDRWAPGIRELSRRGNVNAKISGVIAYAGGDWTVETLRPYVDHVIDCFGWDRVVWGSDSPVCTLGGTLEQWVATTQALIAGASAAERDAFTHLNARRIWGLPG